MKSVQIKAEYNQLLKMKPVNKSGSALGTHRFQRALVARGPLKSNGATRRDCALEAMRTQARVTKCSLQWIFICTAFNLAK
jgi:hypothetical protein